MRRTTCIIAALTMALLTMGDIATAVEATLWKAGVAKVKITPQGPYFAAGYGGEKRIATEKHHDLWIKVLALEDAQGQRGAHHQRYLRLRSRQLRCHLHGPQAALRIGPRKSSSTPRTTTLDQ